MKKITLLIALLLFATVISKSSEPRLILVEQITTSSANSPQLLPIAQQFNQIVNNNPDVIPMTIHTNFNIDQFYKDNPPLSKRILIYKEENQQYPIPSFYVNGKEVFGIGGLQAKINAEKNRQIPIKMKVQLGEPGPTFIPVEVKIDLDTNLNSDNQLFCALVEGHINAPGAGNPAESDFYYVTREIDLQPTRGAMIVENKFHFFGYEFQVQRKDMWNLDELYAIAWIQNIITGEVLQVEKQKVYNEKPAIVSDKDTVFFDDTNKNDAQAVELFNSTMGHLQFESISIDNTTDFTLNHNQSEMMLTAGIGKLLNVELKNLEIGTYTANITIKSNAENTPELVIPIIAKVESNANPVITADVSNLDFGKVSKQKTMKVSLTNTGIGNLEISSIDFLDNNDGVFSVLNGSATTLEPNSTLFLEVNFKPKEEISYFSTLQIHSNATNSPTLSINVKGEGNELEQFSSIALSDATLDFGKTNYTTPVKKSIVITNGGNIDLKLNHSGIEDDADGVFNFVGEKDITIPAGSMDSLVIEFLPKEKKTYSGNLVVRSDVTDPAKRRIEIPLTGEGDGPSSVESFVEGFGVTYFGHSLNINIKNNSIRNINILLYDLNGSLLKEMNKIVAMGENQVTTSDLPRNQVIMFKVFSGEKLIGTGKFINN